MAPGDVMFPAYVVVFVESREEEEAKLEEKSFVDGEI